MRSYIVDLSGSTLEMFLFKENPLNEKIKKLKELGFSNTLTSYNKRYSLGKDPYDYIEVYMWQGVDYMRYKHRSGKLDSPSEITKHNTDSKKYKQILDALREDFKTLKKFGILK